MIINFLKYRSEGQNMRLEVLMKDKASKIHIEYIQYC